MKPYFLITYFIIVCQITFSNNIDSLRTIINSVNDTKTLSVAYRNVAKFYSESKPDSALKYFNKSIILSRKLNNDSLIFENQYSMSDIYLKIGKHDVCFKTLDSCEIILKRFACDECSIRVSSLLGGVHFTVGNYDEALAYYLKSLVYYQENKLENQEARLLYNIGNIYYSQKEYEAAKNNYQRSLEIREKINDIKGTYYVFNGLGTIYRIQEKYDTALYYLRKSLSVGKKFDNLYFISNAYNNIGNVYLFLNNHDSAVYHYNNSLEMNRLLGNKKSVAQTLNNLGDIYISIKKEYEKGIKSCQEAYEIVTAIRSKFDIQQSCICLSEGYEKLNDFKNAFTYYQLYATYKDSLFNESKSKEIGKLEATYEIEKKQAEEDRLRQEQERIEQEEKERRDNIQYSLIFLGILTVFGIVLGSGKFNISTKFAEGLIFFAFLIFFEFCLVLLDPIIDDWSSGEPVYKLLFNAVLAGAIFPLHAFFERLLKSKIIK
jgi:tetratricopeptide (TPR) repeat protein